MCLVFKKFKLYSINPIGILLAGRSESDLSILSKMVNYTSTTITIV